MQSASLDNSLASLGALLVVVAGIVAYHFLGINQARAMLERWARESGYDLLAAKYVWYGGPYWWRKGRGQWVFAISVRHLDGTHRRGHALCGNWLLGLSVNQVTVDLL